MANNDSKAGKFMASKRELREGAFILYFEKQFRDDSIEDIYEVTCEAEGADDQLRISEGSYKLALRVWEKRSELDDIIAEYSKKRSLSRISKINIAILHLALYEAVYEEKVPVNVAISEAVILAQKYAQDQDIAFINGVLGSFSRDHSND